MTASTITRPRFGVRIFNSFMHTPNGENEYAVVDNIDNPPVGTAPVLVQRHLTKPQADALRDRMNRVAPIRIVGRAAADIASHAAHRADRHWTEVQGMWECDHGCKLYVRRQGAVLQYRLFHSKSYGCDLGRYAATREVRVSIAPRASA